MSKYYNCPMNRIKYILPIIIVVLMFNGFLIGCSSESGSDKMKDYVNSIVPKEKVWVLNEESVMDYDSLTSNYEFLGEWKMEMKMGNISNEMYYEYYNSNDKNLCYLMIKDNTMTIYEKKRDGNKYWGINKEEYYVIDENGELICYDAEGLMSKDELKSYGITFTKIR